METKEINDFIHDVIGSEGFKNFQEQVAQELIEKVKELPLKSNDDVQLVMIKIKEKFLSDLNEDATKWMVTFMRSGDSKNIEKNILSLLNVHAELTDREIFKLLGMIDSSMKNENFLEYNEQYEKFWKVLNRLVDQEKIEKHDNFTNEDTYSLF